MKRQLTSMVVAALVSGVAEAQPPGDLATRPIEDLMNIEITSASRVLQRRSDAAAPVYVLTHEDIVRSGASALPELLRRVPGMHVARINSNEWAVSARGFDDLWATKLLVLIDGRSIYSRTFSGVDWNALDLMLEDIERIEVIRGPGATLWGANAVNGVVNIITRSAHETQGGYLALGTGQIDRGHAGVRYGGSAGNTAYRVFSQWTDRDGLRDASNRNAGDTWYRLTSGARADWTRGPDAIAAEVSFVGGRQWPLWASFTGPAPGLSVTPATSADTLTNPTASVRWTHAYDDDSALQVQSSADVRRRRVGTGVTQDENLFDAEAQFTRRVAGRHELVAGGGVRHGDMAVDGTLLYNIVPSPVGYHTFNAFVNDEVALPGRLRVSAGARYETDDQGGDNVQPSIRAIWRFGDRQHVWAGWAKAVRTPALSDLYMRVGFAAFADPRGLPVLVAFVGNPDFQSERTYSVDAGYRIERRTVSLDANVFRGFYDHLATAEPLPPALELAPAPAHLLAAYHLENQLSAGTSGVELAAHWMPSDTWRIDTSYTGFRYRPRLAASSQDSAAATTDGNAPAHQWNVHSWGQIGGRLDVDGAVYRVGRLGQLQVPSYFRADVRAAMLLRGGWSVAAAVQNLFDAAHAEFANGTTFVTATEVPRSVDISLTWRGQRR